MRAFARRLAVESGGDPLAFLDRLNRALYRDIRHDIRPQGVARPPEETLALGHGACRDVTVLFCAACRRELPRPRRRTKWPARNRWFLRCPVFFPFKLRHCVVATVIARNCRCG